MATARVSVGTAAQALLVALLACAAARTAVVVGGTACDGVSCGMGTCSELPAPLLPVPAYECDCDAGWARILPALLFTPCIVPTCSSDVSCYTPTIKVPPPGSNVTLHPCLVVDCGREGMCVEEQDKPFRCQCNSGATNMLNNPSLPCTKNCAIGEDGCPVPNPPPPPPPPSSMAPPDNGTDPPGTPASSSSKGNPTVPTSLAGSVSLQNLLLLASLAALYVV